MVRRSPRGYLSPMNDSQPAAAAGTVRLGDREVNRLGFGAMRITGEGIWGPPVGPRRRAHRVLQRSLELGVQLIDTADSYGPEVSEELIADALHPYPDDVVIATKGGLERGGPGPVERERAARASARGLRGQPATLRVDQIDLYQLHSPDVGRALRGVGGRSRRAAATRARSPRSALAT